MYQQNTAHDAHAPTNIPRNLFISRQAMIDTAHLSAGDLAQEYLWRPMVLFFEPILLVYNTYLALIYGTSPVS